jgi:hypothetical protein
LEKIGLGGELIVTFHAACKHREKLMAVDKKRTVRDEAPGLFHKVLYEP